MITGFHTIVYSDDAEATRAFFRDVLEWPSLDAGGGWLIFKTPPSEMGIHPSTGPGGEQWAAIRTSRRRSCATTSTPRSPTFAPRGSRSATRSRKEDYGRVTSIVVPSAGSLMLYQPHHGLAHQLEG